MNFTNNNHLKYYIGDRLFSQRQNATESFKVTVGSIDHVHYKNSNYLTELHRIADMVYHDFGNDFGIFLSGGTDSEIVVRNFVDIGIKPKCFTIKFEDDLNMIDVIEAKAIAKELSVPIHIIDVNVKDFAYSGQAKDLADKLQCTQLAYLLVYSQIIKFGSPAIMGGELMLRRSFDPYSYWNYVYRENEDASAIRCSLLYDIPIVYVWFSYTPEIMLYYFEHPDIVSLINTQYNYKLSSVSSKNAILNKLVPNVRPKAKTHGFEKLLGLNTELYRQLGNSQIAMLEPNLDGIKYNEIIKMLRGNNENS
jgi:hypothetical protein